MDEEYRPVFCHHCGTNLNPLEDYDDFYGGGDTDCGWCHSRHGIDGVKACRKLARISDQAVFKGTIEGLLALRERVQR